MKLSHSEKPSLTEMSNQQMKAPAPGLGEQKVLLPSDLHYHEQFTGRRRSLSFEQDIQDIFFPIWGLTVSLHKSAWRLKPNCLCWSPALLWGGPFMRVFIHLRGQEESFSLQLLPMNQLAASLPIFFLQDFQAKASTTLQVRKCSEKSGALFPVSSLFPGREKLGICTFVTYLL